MLVRLGLTVIRMVSGMEDGAELFAPLSEPCTSIMP